MCRGIVRFSIAERRQSCWCTAATQARELGTLLLLLLLLLLLCGGMELLGASQLAGLITGSATALRPAGPAHWRRRQVSFSWRLGSFARLPRFLRPLIFCVLLPIYSRI